MNYRTHFKAAIIVMISTTIASAIFAKDERRINLEDTIVGFNQFDFPNNLSNVFGSLTQTPNKLWTTLYIEEHNGTPIIYAALLPHEKLLIDNAQASGLAEDYEKYLKQYPNGIYVEFALSELAMIALRDAENKAESSEKAPKNEGNSGQNVEITSKTPLEIGEGILSAISIEQLIVNSPLFPPVEGLPDEYWKGKKCSNCHKWNVTNLCEQGKTYLADKNAEALQKKHPFGGKFKINIRSWAETGCN